MAANGMCRPRATGVRISPTTRQARRASVATLEPSTVSAPHRRAWAACRPAPAKAANSAAWKRRRCKKRPRRRRRSHPATKGRPCRLHRPAGRRRAAASGLRYLRRQALVTSPRCASGGEPLLRKWAADLVADGGDRANIGWRVWTMPSRSRGPPSAPAFGHQQVAPMGENRFRALDT
jgi:hypothetical protein